MDKHNTQHDFKGFGDWIEIFKAGTHTDSQGRTASYSQADLDDIVANHSEADAAPIVIGHPKTNDPAWGWTAELKRDGDSLYFKARDVEPTFEEAVEKGRYRKRSVRLVKTGNGLKLRHIGFLGAKPPAVDGLAALNFEENEGDCLDFETDWETPNALARIMRRFREFLIEKFGLEEADNIVPDWEVDSISRHAAVAQDEALSKNTSRSFSQPEPEGDSTMGEFTQEQLDQAVNEAREDERNKASSEFSAKEETLQEQLDKERRSNRARDFQAAVDTAIDDGKLTPAQAEGAVAFMLSLDAEQAFEFSSGEGDDASTLKKSPVQWFQDFMQSLGKQVDFNETVDDGVGAPAGDAQSIANKALEFQKSEKDAGREISISQAVAHITKGGK